MNQSAAPRVPELDGFRGVAILLVLLGHVAAGTAPANRHLFSWWAGGRGGLIGVQMFFVLSGYLITSVILRELDATDTVSMRNFYARRLRRLMPALVVVSAAYTLFALSTGKGLRTAVAPSIRSLTYTANLPFATPSPGWLSHTWSLAVEEQFYLVWPWVALLAYKLSRNTVAFTALAACAVTLALRWFAPVSDSNAYNLLRWDALLIGCVVAVRPISLPRALGVAGWGVVAWYAILDSGRITALDYTVTTVASVVVLITSRNSRVLRNPILCWFGLISYGLYLWHVLILRLGPPPIVGAGISIGFAAMSYYFVELKFLRPRVPTTVMATSDN